MGNYTGKTELIKVKVDRDNPKDGLIQLIVNLDSDYEEYAEQIVDNIMNDPQNNDVIKMIDAVIDGNFGEVIEDGEDVLVELSTWILNNDTYCSGYQRDIVNNNKHELVIICLNL